MKANPLVSIFIVTYNSSDYIIEALESAKAQTYQNVELIVSDDKSKDDTVEIVKKWLSINSERFIRTEIVEALVNTGTSGNYNRAVAACKGDWLKMMDGDDLILPNCIEDNISYVLNHPDAEIIFSDEYKFSDKGGNRIIRTKQFTPKRKSFFDLDTYSQRIMLLSGNILPSQTCFISARLLRIYRYNENYTLLEDYPMWISLLEHGHHFYYLDKCTAMYRETDSVSSNSEVLFPVYYTEICRSFYQEVLLPLIKKYEAEEAFNTQKKYFQLYYLCLILFKNKRNRLTVFLCWCLRVFFKFFIHYRL